MDKSLNYKYIENSYKIIIIILIVINQIILSHKKIMFEYKPKETKKNTKPVISNYQLFNQIDERLFTLILDFSDSNINLNSKKYINFMNNITKQTFEDIQILMMYNSSNYNIIDNITNKFIKDRNIETHLTKNELWSEKFLYLAQKIKGKFLLLLNDTITFKNDEFYKIYNKTKGSIQNILEFNFDNNQTLYLLRTKKINEIIDSEIKFNDYNQLINYIKQIPLNPLNYIPIAYCPNNYYTALTYVSMLSILVTKQPYTYILFYLVITKDFSKRNIEFIERLYEQFDYFNITFISMDKRYENAYTKRYLTKNAFYRFSLGELLPDLNKIIYLDSDTICLKDLSNLYDLNFLGKIFIARIITYQDIKNYDFTVNTGVLLLNLKKMRQKKIEQNVLNLLNSGFTDPTYHDQAIVNKFYKKYVGFLSPEYNRIVSLVSDYYKKISGLYDLDSIYFYRKFASIIHYPGHPRLKTYSDENWYYFARKSKYFRRRSHNYSNIFYYLL